MDASQRTVRLSEATWATVSAEAAATGEPVATIVDRRLCESFGLERHTLFQVSTSTALAEGVFAGEMTVAELLEHGDFGIGTFDQLDGELIIVDGRCHRASDGGRLEDAAPEWTVPFAVVTHFVADVRTDVGPVDSLDALEAHLDRVRPSQNVFVAVRVSGRFDSLALRTASRAEPGEDLVEATNHQSEFALTDVAGTLVGFWTPDHVRSVGIPGYHFHFVGDDRRTGGHVLDLEAGDLTVELDVERAVHLALPSTREFLEADLRSDASGALEVAESARAERALAADDVAQDRA